MLHDQGGSNRVQREGTSKFDGIELPPTLLWLLLVIVQKSCRINHETNLTLRGGELPCPLQTGLVQQVDWR